jgi:non-specific serine/threonine protein kinase/serine/threonine-protein kinase
MVGASNCPQCGKPVAPEVREALCPRCLLKLGLDGPRETPTSTASTRDIDALLVEDGDRRIGPYRLLHRLGEGGMGEVWLAEQQEPVRRKVALKLIKAGMDTKQVIARFESERQALALMNHPSIARVFDAGATERGLPYFAMEYVKGEPITSYCDRHRLPMQERLELFMRVCNGVQHAHQKGIIHRDIKPSNVLVAIQDDKPVPKIIDFGVAKATQQRLTEKTVFTQMGVMIGTPEYMSPEQAEMTGLDVDTRTDVYSLGVMLYELLTGALPFDSKQLREAGFDEIRRRIREEEPSKPSTRLSTSGDGSTESASARRSDPSTLARLLRGDLDWITMMALEKDRTRRYGSPSELAADVSRHLKHEPVVASPPGTAYRMGKFVRRHRLGVLAAAAVLLALIVGLAGATWGLIRAQRAEVHAKQEAATAEQVSGFLVGLFEVSDPSEARGNSITAREILDKGAREIDETLSDRPAVQSRLMRTMGNVYRNLGLYEQARPLLEGALETRRQLPIGRDSTTTQLMNDLAILYGLQGSYEQAEPILLEAIEEQRRMLGNDHPATLTSLNSLGMLYLEMNRYEEAEQIMLEALGLQTSVLGVDHIKTLITMSNLALLCTKLGRYEDAERFQSEALDRQRRVLGPDHPSTLLSMGNLATVYSDQGRNVAAETLFNETLQIRRRVLGSDHPETLSTMNNLALLFDRQDRYEEAEPLFVETLDVARRVLGADHVGTLVTMGNLGYLYVRQGRYDKAEPLLAEAVQGVRRSLPRVHLVTGFTFRKYGACLTKLHRYDEAEEQLLQAHDAVVASVGAEHREAVTVATKLADLYDAWGKSDKATEWRAKLPVQDPE